MIEKKFLVLVPAYNEEKNISSLLSELQAQSMGFDVVVIDDGSSDSTCKVAGKKDVPVISHVFNLGIGGAVQTGILYAFQRGYDIVIQVDGDGQHDPRFIEKLLTPLLSEECDIAIGSRFLDPFAGYRSSFIRRIGINFFAVLISFLTGCPVTDPTSGFRAMNRKAIKVFSEYYPIDFPEPESIMVAKRMGLRIQEIPVEMRKRLAGISSIRYCKTFYYMIKVTFAILLDKLKKKGKGD